MLTSRTVDAEAPDERLRRRGLLRHGRLPVAGPWITELEVAYASDAAATGWYSHAGDYISRFEHAFASYVGRRHAVSLPSCTSGLHLALAALGIGDGDEVIVPSSTWIATSAPVSYVGATPVFVDVDPSSWCLTADSVRAGLSERTRAIIAVDLYGGMPMFDELEALAREHSLVIIEDAAEAVGSAVGPRKAGSFGAASVFSFHGSKTVTTGEGGMLLTDDDDLMARVLQLRDHGRAPGDVEFFNEEVAFKYKMSPVQAAIGLAQVERVEELTARKREIYGWYREQLAECPLVLNAEATGTTNAYWMATAVLDETAGSSRELRRALAAANCDTRPFFHPLPTLPAYRGPGGRRHRAVDSPVATRLARQGLNLPSAMLLDDADVTAVCDAVRHALR